MFSREDQWLSDKRDLSLSRLLVQCNQDVFKRGYEACMEGQSRFSCPYDVEYHQRLWQEGYDSAMTEMGQCR